MDRDTVEALLRRKRTSAIKGRGDRRPSRARVFHIRLRHCVVDREMDPCELPRYAEVETLESQTGSIEVAASMVALR